MTLNRDNRWWLRQYHWAVIIILPVLGLTPIALGQTPGEESNAAGNLSPASTLPLQPVLIADTVPTTARDVAGGQVNFTAVFRDSPAAIFQWQKISNGVAFDIPNATTTTLTLTNLQPADSGYYQLKAVNATNRSAVTYASTCSLAVDRMPAAVSNVVTAIATQTGLGGTTTFTPTWPVMTTNSLIAGQPPAGISGNFSLETSGRNVNSLTAGGSLAINSAISDQGFQIGHPTCCTNYVTCGDLQAGSSVTYALTGSANGYDLTSITVFGGWIDNGRDQQAYTVYFSTVPAPDLFIPLSTVNYNPAAPARAQSATRVTLTPANGFLAKNVAAVKFDFTSPVSKNGYGGYSQILVSGVGSASLPPGPELPGDGQVLTGTGISSALGGVDLMGSWIWDAKTYDAQTCQFWRAFDIPANGKVTHARLCMTVDNEYELFVDGHEIGRGDDWRELFDYDLTPLMYPGRHVLAIKAFNSLSDAGLTLGLRVELADGRFVEIKSDRNWRIVPNDARNWEEMTEAHNAWPAATIIAAMGSSPWWTQPESINTMLVPRPVKIFFWQEPWFQITFLTLCGLCLLTIFFLAAQLALHQKERWLLQRERARIAMDIHDDIGSRITQLVLSGEDAQEELPEDSNARMKLAEIWDDAREVLSSIDEILWALNPRLDTLRDFANYICDYAHKILEPSGIVCAFDVDPQMQLTAADLPLRRSLLMAIKETLNNIVKHSGATEVRLKIERQHQYLIVEVIDNGRGFDLTAIKPGRNGLSNMSRRMRELGGNCHLTSQPGKGCHIEFNIPLKRSRKFSWFKK